MINTSALIENINLKGYQVVERRMFKKSNVPTMNIFSDAIAFNKDCHVALNSCENIKIMVNLEAKAIVVGSCTSSEENSILWDKHTKDTYIPRFTCEELTKMLFSVWKLNPGYHYRAGGRLVKAENKLMLLFDFEDCETYDGSKRISRRS